MTVEPDGAIAAGREVMSITPTSHTARSDSHSQHHAQLEPPEPGGGCSILDVVGLFGIDDPAWLLPASERPGPITFALEEVKALGAARGLDCPFA